MENENYQIKDIAAAPGGSVSGNAKTNITEWIPPVYSQSKSIRLDLKNAIENRCVCIKENSPEIDYYKVLRTQIQQRTKEKNLNTVMVTSVNPGEGKTLTSINLAVTFARELNQTVLLVDCDLKQQTIYKRLGFSGEKGLIDYLVDNKPLKDLIIWPGIEKLTLLSGGRAIQDSSELLGSPRMAALVAEMKTRYADRYIFFDVPSVLVGADVIAFTSLVDSIILVVEAGITSLNDVKKALELLPKEKFLGFVFNRQKLLNKTKR